MREETLIEKIKKLDHKNMTVSDIVKATGRGKNTVKSALCKYGLSYKKHVPDVTLIQKITELLEKENLSCDALAKRLNITPTKTTTCLSHMYNVAEDDDGKCFLVR